ncbi:amidase [Paraburkholderia ferrariae]|uniref:amidase n=1 Tax=Paraburkholderia ferrariae TaxID=386056 RepID=UPI0004802B1A|nr:amidase [Paraburkholderia ferrariae]
MTRTVEAVTAALAGGQTSAAALLDGCVGRAGCAGGEGARVFPYGVSAAAHVQAASADMLRSIGVAGPLAGVPVSVKDLFDVQGEVTRAGSRAMPEVVARRDATAITRLRSAGAVFVGRTNMTEFAYSGVGINPHYGTPLNPHDRVAGRIPGGSSSGAAVSVADAMAIAAIGSDTGGSCRIPAALCGIVGFKPTASRIPLQGAVPLSSSYDSIGSLANSVACCATLDAVMAGEEPAPLARRNVRGLRLAVPMRVVLDGMSDAVARAWSRSLTALSAAGAVMEEVAFASWERLGEIGQNGGLVAAEASAWHRNLLSEQPQKYDPRVVSRIRLADAQQPVDYLRMLTLRAELCRSMDGEMAPFDALVMPTVPITAPRVDELEDDEVFFNANRLLLRNPSIANMLNLCSLSVPCHEPGEAPVGLMLFGRHLADRALLETGLAVERLLSPRAEPGRA